MKLIINQEFDCSNLSLYLFNCSWLSHNDNSLLDIIISIINKCWFQDLNMIMKNGSGRGHNANESHSNTGQQQQQQQQQSSSWSSLVKSESPHGLRGKSTNTKQKNIKFILMNFFRSLFNIFQSVIFPS